MQMSRSGGRAGRHASTLASTPRAAATSRTRVAGVATPNGRFRWAFASCTADDGTVYEAALRSVHTVLHGARGGFHNTHYPVVWSFSG